MTHEPTVSPIPPETYPTNPLGLPLTRDWNEDEWQLDQAIEDAKALPRPDIQIERLIKIFRDYLKSASGQRVVVDRKKIERVRSLALDAIEAAYWADESRGKRAASSIEEIACGWLSHSSPEGK